MGIEPTPEAWEVYLLIPLFTSLIAHAVTHCEAGALNCTETVPDAI
jgi:hypothetical protein